jgi:TatD DNase family protein
MVPATDPVSCESVLSAASRFSVVYAAVGIHPNDARAVDDFSALQTLAQDVKVKAIGETGLDYYRTYTTPELQRTHLERHFLIAADRGLPIILHNRDADEDLYAIARAYSPQVRGVLHCFSGSMETAQRFLDLGYYISFAGNVTYSSAGALRKVAMQVPADRILAETDSPYLTPVPRRGRRNEPANVLFIYKVLAEYRDVPEAALVATIAANAQRLFGW